MGREEAIAFALLSSASLSSSAWDPMVIAPGDFVVSEQSQPTLNGVNRMSRPWSECRGPQRATSEREMSGPEELGEDSGT